MSEFPKFKVVRQTEYGPVIERVKRQEVTDDLTEEGEVEEVAGRDGQSPGGDVQVIVERETPYGPIIKRVRTRPQGDQIVTPKNITETTEEDSIVAGDKETTLREYLEKKFGQLRTGLEARTYNLTEGQRKQLRAVLMAAGISVVPVKYMNDYPTATDSKQTTTEVSEVSYQESPNSPSAENTKASFGEDLEDDIRQYEKMLRRIAKLPMGSGSVDIASAERRPATADEQSEPLDTFGREVAKFATALNEQDVDFMKQNARQRVIGAEEYDRIWYVREAIKFKEWDEERQTGVPPAVQDELRRVLPGLCAQESKFHNGLESRSGAKGIWQFMPNTLAGYQGTPQDLLSFKRQVEIAGDFISDLYKQINHHVGKQGMEKLRSRFRDEETFQRELIVPLIINAYNAGAKGISDEVVKYLKRTPIHRMPTRRDLFVDIINKSDLNEEQRQYVFKSYRWLNIEELGSERV